MPTSPKGTFFGHPRPLARLFNVELWERFSYYGMQSILLIYLYYEVTRGGLGIDQGLAGSMAGSMVAASTWPPFWGPGCPTGCGGRSARCSIPAWW